MGCVFAKSDGDFENCGGRKRRHSWRRTSLSKSMRMAAIRQREQAAAAAAAAKLQEGAEQAGNFALQASSRRSSLAGVGRSRVVCPEPPAVYDFCCSKRDNPEDDYLCQLDGVREQKRNEFEDFGTSPHFTLGAFDRLEFDLTPMENPEDAFF
ncbi:hypothetical protein BOX15_Mlig024312g1 [Macrostomum lignano]|nr:hypothetical protein BOX15_Mlig015830g2 [Macrostomum lignano]PAA59759.1 hypothetical protein BOX15_Mlig024312g1 [Macrostomum lignano]